MTEHQEIWCQPADQTKRQFLVMFDDPQMDVAVFDNEQEARAFWEKANLNWTCYLMGTMPRSPSPETNLVGSMDAACEAVRRWVKDEPYDHPRASWNERLDHCLAAIRSELSGEEPQ